MDNIEKIEKLLKKRNGIIATSEVEELGVNSRILTRMIERGIIERGIIERVARGIYISVDTIEDTYFTTQAICKKGIFSHETALYFHDLCDRTPIKFQLTVPSNYNNISIKNSNYQFFYLKEELYNV